MKVSSTEFQQHVGKYLSNLENLKANEILITKHGKPVFKLISLSKEKKTNTEMLLELLQEVPTTPENTEYNYDDVKLQKVTDYENLT